MAETRTKTCPTCGRHFSYQVGKGRDRKYCSQQCRTRYQLAFRKERLKKLPRCKTENCNNRATRVTYELCESCYYRLRRNGTTAKKPFRYRYRTGAGYIKVLDPNHPLADSSGNVFEHRRMLYKMLGPGQQTCYWCGARIEWATAVADHINEQKDDNRLENLVLSCNNCNRARGAMLPFVKRLRPEAMSRLIDCIIRVNDA